jgi:hypothetical protein
MPSLRFLLLTCYNIDKGKMPFIACVVLCAVFCLSVVCYFVRCMLFVCCVLLYYHCHRVKTHLQFK